MNDGVLASQRELAEIALQTNQCLASEQACAGRRLLLQCTGVGAKTRFKREQCAQATAQILCSLETDTAAAERTACFLQFAATGSIFVGAVTHGSIDNAVDGDIALCI